MKHKLIALILSLNFISTALLSQTTAVAPGSFFDQMIEENTEKIEIFTDLEELLVKKSREEVNAFLVLNMNGKPVKVDAKLSVRGKYRARVCDFPPVKLNLKKSSLKEIVTEYKFDKYKIVSHCLNDLAEAKANLEKEKLTYEMYEAFTPYSYRTHNLEIVYRDIHDSSWKVKAPAFIIESNKQLEDRLDGELIDTLGLTMDNMDIEAVEDMVLFNFMIGNLDWDLTTNKNVKFLWLEDKKKFVPISYDFDFTSFVAPSYLKLFPNMGQTKWDDRVFKLPESEGVDLSDNIDRLYRLKKSYYSMLRTARHIQEKDELRMRKFLDSFFDVLIYDLKSVNHHNGVPFVIR